MKKTIIKPIIPSGRYQRFGRGRLNWIIRRGRDYQLMPVPKGKRRLANTLASHRGPRTSLAGRHR